MTYIVTDGNFLIADKRTSFHTGTRKTTDHFKAGALRKQSTRDDSVKIILAENVLYKGTKVTAMGFAGPYHDSNTHMLNTLSLIKDVETLRTLLNNDVINAAGFEIIVDADVDGSHDLALM